MKEPGCPFNHFGPTYISALSTHTDTQMLAFSLGYIRTMLGLPQESLEEYYLLQKLRAFSGELKRVAASLSVDPAVSQRAAICWDKVNRILDILCEDEEEEE